MYNTYRTTMVESHLLHILRSRSIICLSFKTSAINHYITVILYGPLWPICHWRGLWSVLSRCLVMNSNHGTHEEHYAQYLYMYTRASIVCENIMPFSRDFYETILVGKFPSHEISEKCTSRHWWITDIQTQSFLPFHRTQHNVRILAVVSLSAALTRRQWRWGSHSGDSGHRLRHHLCNLELRARGSCGIA